MRRSGLSQLHVPKSAWSLWCCEREHFVSKTLCSQTSGKELLCECVSSKLFDWLIYCSSMTLFICWTHSYVQMVRAWLQAFPLWTSDTRGTFEAHADLSEPLAADKYGKNFTHKIISWQDVHLAVQCRNWRLFRYIFGSYCLVWSTVSLNFH